MGVSGSPLLEMMVSSSCPGGPRGDTGVGLVLVRVVVASGPMLACGSPLAAGVVWEPLFASV
jgi:hypothetical protein